ncbi:hypothetical protein [Streptomyces sp. NBC_01481]|uniref:hypothetical protein n=1 Tax=Streptomyces sp. NBC_01481 TaxID=2975869 RepID=UPI00225AB5BA|nr:hypothetical protein [Streptomyces sp. NBC_01481]MCX4587059.1 hypothetical protein [Streptomyces sp. NBC_01481]
MFELRIICDPADTDRITTALNGLFDTGSVRRLPSRHTDMDRLYVTADHRASHEDCTVCGGEGTSLWFTPEGTEETRPCTGIPYEDMLAAGLIRRNGKAARPYVDADPKLSPWPSPETAYATAPCISIEIGWTAYHAVGRPTGALLGREFWLRKAAVLDRIALGDQAGEGFGDACEAATEAARHLLDIDRAEGIADPRGYVRQQYAQWAENQ